MGMLLQAVRFVLNSTPQGMFAAWAICSRFNSELFWLSTSPLAVTFWCNILCCSQYSLNSFDLNCGPLSDLMVFGNPCMQKPSAGQSMIFSVVGRVFSCSVILITLISLSVLLRLQTTSFKKKSSHRTRGAYHDPKYLGEYTGNANFQNAQYRAFHLITWRTNLRLLVLAKIKRSQTPTTRYHDCVFTFHPIIKLLHDIELNPARGTESRNFQTAGKQDA